MKMAHQKSQRCYFNSRVLFLLLSVLSIPLYVKGEELGTASEYENEEVVKDVIYMYDLFQQDSGKWDCEGILRISLSLPDHVERIILNRKIRNYYIMSCAKSVYPGNTTEIEISKVYWNSCFNITIHYENGDIGYSPIYSVSDYVDEQDLELLQQSSIKDIDSGKVELHVENRTLYVDTAERITLSIYDTCGRQIFTGNMDHPQSIALNNISSPVIIVNYTDSHESLTKKLIVK